MRCGCVSNRSCLGMLLVPSEDASTNDGRGVGANRFCREKFSRPSYMCCAPVASGRRSPRTSAVPAPFITIFSNGERRVSSSGCGKRGWRSTMTWPGLPGNGKAWTGPKAKLLWHRRPWETTQQTGGKKGTKRSLLVDGRGAPLSLIVAGANRHDVKLLAQTLDAIVVPRPKPTKRRPQNLCVDKGYAGKPADKQMRERGYIPHVPQKGRPRARFQTGGRARRWVVERTHSWMNNYRKLRVRYEKKAANFEALLHLAIAIICWRM
jgi:putative transposase